MFKEISFKMYQHNYLADRLNELTAVNMATAQLTRPLWTHMVSGSILLRINIHRRPLM